MKEVKAMFNVYVWIIVMALSTAFTRLLPFTLLKKPIENAFIQSFLYYVPYVTLAVMTFPAITHSTQSEIAGLIAMLGGILAAWLGANLFGTACVCCAIVFIMELFL